MTRNCNFDARSNTGAGGAWGAGGGHMTASRLNHHCVHDSTCLDLLYHGQLMRGQS